MKKNARIRICSVSVIGAGLVCLFMMVSPAYSRVSRGTATSAMERTRAWEHHQELEKDSLFKDLVWRSVGPEFCGGRIETIACHPAEPFTIYVGAGFPYA